MSLNPFRKGTKLYAISELLLKGMTREEIFRAIYPLVLNQSDPFVYSDNVGNARVPKQIHDQIPLAFYDIGRVRNSLLDKRPETASVLAPESTFDSRNYNDKRWRARFYAQIRDEFENNGGNNNTPAPISNENSEPNEPRTISVRDKVEYLVRRLYEIRKFCRDRKVNNREFDYVSTRAFVHGTKAVLAGIEPDDFLVSIGLSWNPETRREAGIKDTVDFARYAIPDTPRQFGFVLKLVEARIPVYLYGPTGSGKSVIARMVADHVSDGVYGEIPLSCGVSRTDLFGNWNASGFIGRPLIEIYPNGGVFCFEEMDAADPNILLAVNNAVANDVLFNTSNGDELQRSEDFIPIATANTLGNGATSNYSAREGLDGSTLDRFKYGRVEIDYNPEVERGIVDSIMAAAAV